MYFSVIKVWDLRKNYAAYRQDPVPFKSFFYPGTSTRKLGKLLDGSTLFALHLAKTTERMGFFIVVFESRAILETVWYKNNTVIARIALTLYLAPYSTTQ